MFWGVIPSCLTATRILYDNSVDCALAKVDNGFNGANREIHWIGYPNMKIIGNNNN